VSAVAESIFDAQRLKSIRAQRERDESVNGLFPTRSNQGVGVCTVLVIHAGPTQNRHTHTHTLFQEYTHLQNHHTYLTHTCLAVLSVILYMHKHIRVNPFEFNHLLTPCDLNKKPSIAEVL
jgi:hypothetical protein